MKAEESEENKNALILENRGKRLAIITVRGILDSNTKSINSCKAQCKRKRGKLKRAKYIRKEIFQELRKEIREIKVIDMIVVRDFNEDFNANNAQKFLVEMGLREVFSELHG